MPDEVEGLRVHQSIVAVMRAVDHVAKREGGSGLGYKFRGIDAVINAVGPKLRDAGVFILPTVEHYGYETVKSSAGKDMASVRLTVRFRFIGPMGDEMSAVVVGEAFDSGDKATAKAMSVALRTCLLQVLALPTDEPDPDAQTYERGDEQERDLGKWTGEVAAAGTDKAKLSALWARMKAEWDNVPWSPDRHAIIEAAVKRAAQAAEAAPDPAPEPASADAEQYADAFLIDMDKAVSDRDLPALRQLVKQAANARRSDLRKLAAAAIEDMGAK